MINELSKTPSALSVFINEIRDESIQKDPLRFRKNLERIGFIIALEISKELEYSSNEIQTPLGLAEGLKPEELPVLATILRAGLPMHQGMLDVFDRSENAFVSAYRKYQNDGEFEIEIEYLSSPSIDDKIVILCDPMIATGASMELAFKALLKKGSPKKIYVAAAIASTPGLNHLKHVMPSDTSYVLGVIDEELTARSYIVPGLGDAGDLAFGEKC